MEKGFEIHRDKYLNKSIVFTRKEQTNTMKSTIALFMHKL